MKDNNYLSQLPILTKEKIILPKQVQKNLIQAVEKILQQTDTKEYRNWMKSFFSSDDSPLPENIKKIVKNFVQDIESPFNKNFASFDFHLSGEENDEPKLIEFSFFPVGDSFIRGVIPSEFSEHYQKNFLELLKKNSPSKKIAIVDTKISEQKRMAEFLWTQEFLEAEGFEVFLADAESVGAYPCGRPKKEIFVTSQAVTERSRSISVDYLLNRCTFSDYLKNPENFSGLIEVEKTYPEKISTTFREWVFSEKISSVYFTEKKILQEYIPKTIFSTPEVTEEKIITSVGKKNLAKPLFSYFSKGIFLNPSVEKILEINKLSQPYIFQEICPAPELPDGRKFEVRIFIIQGKISIFAARVYNGELSNYNDSQSGICAVEFE